MKTIYDGELTTHNENGDEELHEPIYASQYFYTNE